MYISLNPNLYTFALFKHGYFQDQFGAKSCPYCRGRYLFAARLAKIIVDQNTVDLEFMTCMHAWNKVISCIQNMNLCWEIGWILRPCAYKNNKMCQLHIYMHEIEVIKGLDLLR